MSNQNPNRPHTDHQKEERDQHGDTRSSQNQHRNPTHETDSNAQKGGQIKRGAREEE